MQLFCYPMFVDSTPWPTGHPSIFRSNMRFSKASTLSRTLLLLLPLLFFCSHVMSLAYGSFAGQACGLPIEISIVLKQKKTKPNSLKFKKNKKLTFVVSIIANFYSNFVFCPVIPLLFSLNVQLSSVLCSWALKDLR